MMPLRFRKLLPTETEMEGMFGVGVAAFFMLADRYLPRAP